MIIKNYTQSGFTLLETMVAIAILLIAVVGPISLIGNSLHQIYYARDEMSAVNLAQEGIEAVRRVRDTNMIVRPSGGWDKDLKINKYYSVDSTNMYIWSDGTASPSSFLIPCNGAGCNVAKPIFIDPTTGLYRQNAAGAPTQFSRVVDINQVAINEYTVTCTVTWTTGGQTGSVVVSENIFNWAS